MHESIPRLFGKKTAIPFINSSLIPKKHKEDGDLFRHKTTLRLGKEGFEVIKREIFQNWFEQAAPSNGENTPK
ncbi:MAG: hypothetical protein WCH40_03295 [Verrucomicrobiales bacterium]